MNLSLQRASSDDLPEALTLIEHVIRQCVCGFASEAEVDALVVAKRLPGDSAHYFDGTGVLLLAGSPGAVVGCLGMQFHNRATSSSTTPSVPAGERVLGGR
ncbi:MAG: hypothetical protein ACRDIC_09390 [bacterium]